MEDRRGKRIKMKMQYVQKKASKQEDLKKQRKSNRNRVLGTVQQDKVQVLGVQVWFSVGELVF